MLNRRVWQFLLLAIIAFILIANQTTAEAQTEPNSNAIQQFMAQHIYNECMARPDSDLATATGQKNYCNCMAYEIPHEINLSDLANLAMSAGKNASQGDIEQTMMSNPKFNGIVQQCLNLALNK